MQSNAPASLVCRVAIAFVWVYQGLVPKLLGPHADELAMNLALGISSDAAILLSYIAGTLEVALGVTILVWRRQAWPLMLTIGLMVGFLAYASWALPRALIAAFNPLTINLAVAALAVVALVLERGRGGEV